MKNKSDLKESKVAVDVAWKFPAISSYANTVETRGTSENCSAATAKVANEPQCRQIFAFQHCSVTLIAWNRRFAVDLSDARPRRWKANSYQLRSFNKWLHGQGRRSHLLWELQAVK